MLSIIIPTFNSGKTLEMCISSVLQQDIVDLEIIIIDGLSSDNTINIIEKYKEQISFFVSEKDLGVYDAMNKGIKEAKGEFLIFLGSDDFLMPNILKNIIPYLKSQSVIYYGNSFFPCSNIIYNGKFNTLKLSTRNICHQAIFYPKSVFIKNQYDLNFKILADYSLNLKLWVDKNFKFEYIPRTISVFNDYEGLSKINQDLKFQEFKFSFIKNNFGPIVFTYFLVRRNLYNVLSSFLNK